MSSHEDEPGPNERLGTKGASEAVSLLEATFDAIHEGILVVDNEGGVVSYNEQFLDLWRIPEKLAEAGDDAALLAYVEEQLEDPEAFQERVEELYEDPEAVSEDRVTFEDGRVFHRTSRPQMDGDEVAGHVWSFRDVTEEEQAKKELENSNEQLENFASLVSHDLQEPLRGIALTLQQLERCVDGALDEKAREHLETAVADAKRCRAMVEGMHELASIAETPPELAPVPLEDVLGEVRQQLEVPINETDATIRHDSLPIVSGERAQLVTLFQILVQNAITYAGDEPPAITIRAESRDDGRIEVEVADEGQGIVKEDQERIFGMFQRGREVAPNGTGIGLALCRRIVDRHGGELGVRSKWGEGSCFTFTLPGASEAAREQL